MTSFYKRRGIQEAFSRSLPFFTHKNVKTLKFLLDAYSAVCVRLMYSLYMRHSIQGEAFNPFLHYFTHKNVKTLKFLMIAYSSLCSTHVFVGARVVH